jgi:hypothetical protein
MSNWSLFDWANTHPVVGGACMVAIGLLGLFVLREKHVSDKKSK